MLYVIKDVRTSKFGNTQVIAIKIAQTEHEVLTYLSKVENLKKFKGDIKIEKVVL